MASSESKGESEWMVFCSHKVPDFEQWLMEYNKIVTTGYLKELGITKSVVCKGENNDDDGNMRICLTHYFPKTCLEKMKKVLDFEAPPFVGGEDLIANGIVIPPCVAFFSEVKNEYAQEG